ncbi:MAG: hypothetical protein K0U98_08195 [Deltaproteobacteria bacterium]|nr:hypothetical protein [Deltaproteobacteria bacterium]
MQEKLSIRRWILAPLSLFALCGLAVVGSFGAPQGPWEGNYPGPEEGEWQTNGRADANQAYCDANFPFTVCTEWCELSPAPPPIWVEVVATGVLCCLDPQHANRPGSPGDCEHFFQGNS